MIVFILLISVAILITIMVSNKNNQSSKQPENNRIVKSRADMCDTVLHISSQLASGSFGFGTMGCKDGLVYMGASKNPGKISGSYKKKNEEECIVYEDVDQTVELGRVHIGHSGDIKILFSIYGKVSKKPHLRQKALSSPKGALWYVAEVLDKHSTVIDDETYEPIAQYEGDPVEAAAAFICWANEACTCGNKYTDYFCLD